MNRIEKIILDGTQYGGNSEPGIKALSASSLNAPVLQNWLRWKHGVLPEDKIKVTNMGSLIHLAIEHLIKKHNAREDEWDIMPEVHLEFPMDNGWDLTGTADIIDYKEGVIYDIKNIKKYRVTKLREQGTKDDYAIQLNAYRFLNKMKTGEDFEMKVFAMSFDGGMDFRSGVDTPVLQIVDVPYIPDEEIIALFNDQVQKLEYHINEDMVPDQCDTWVRKIRGKSVPARCLLYCSYSSVCPQYDPRPQTIATNLEWK